MYCSLSFYISKSFNKRLGWSQSRALAQWLLVLGGIIVQNFKDEEELRYYVNQRDSWNRTALEIICIYWYYEFLDSNEMSVIIKELWHGSNSNNFGLFGCSTNYKILSSGYDTEEAKRLFNA